MLSIIGVSGQSEGLNPSYPQFLSVACQAFTHPCINQIVQDLKRMFQDKEKKRPKKTACRTPQTHVGVRLGRSDTERRPKPLPLVLTANDGSVLPYCTRSEDRRTIHPSVRAWGLRWPPSPGDQQCWCPGAEVTGNEQCIKNLGKTSSKTRVRSTDQ